MSNIYIQEPTTNGKVLLKTTVGDIDIELWGREAPKACRNFIQLCLEGYYDNTIFHRVVKDFIVQGGDPTGTGMGGESIYGEPFKDEVHSRLRFVRRGLVAMANAGKDDNGSQFFFTLGQTPDLQNKHTIFGKVTGPTLYNMIKLEDCLVDQNERPLHPHKILSTEILSNPYDDLLPRESRQSIDSKKEKSEEVKTKGTKDFKLLSFGDEAEEEEEEMNLNADYKGKSKSSHDLLKNDPKLSSVPVIEQSELRASKRDIDEDEAKNKEKKSKRKRIQEKIEEEARKRAELDKEKDKEDTYDDGDDKAKKEQTKLDEVRHDYKLLKKQMAADRKKAVEEVAVEKVHENEAVVEFLKEKEKYKEVSNKIPKKGASREEQALALLAKFKSKLTQQTAKTDTDKGPGADWMAHKFQCQKEDEGPTLAKDANMRGEADWYDIYDPRNPINQRKAAAAAIEASKKKK